MLNKNEFQTQKKSINTITLRENDMLYEGEIGNRKIVIMINDEAVYAYQGESVLSTLLSHKIRGFSQNDHGKVQGPYCGMGVCYCCMVKINGINKQRACQHSIEDDMRIDTRSNHFTTLIPAFEKE